MNLALAKALDRHVGRALALPVSAADALAETLRPPPPVEQVRTILAIKFWGLGNWAVLRPILVDLRARFPAARLLVATLAGNRALVEDLADDLLLVRTGSLGRAAADLVGAAGRLRRARADLALDFEPFAHAGGLLARVGGARQRIGFATAASRSPWYTVLVPFREDAHVGRSFRDLAEAAGVPPAPYRPGALAPGPRDLVETARWREGGPYVVLHPGSGDNFPGRRWSAAGFAAAARTAQRRGTRALLTGSAGERTLCEEVARRAGGAATNLAGRLSVGGLVALLSGARVVVAGDTGPVHLASALGVPVLGIYGPNTPVLYGPLSRGSRAFYRALPCSPCLTAASHRSSRCRIHTCMASIPTGEVTAALDALLMGAAPARTAPCARPPAS